ncbi:MAG TPA: tetratricopeptide repeat protein, partial [Candidatus Obscuribacter sp.]|nr:tetratricopeptide repeat protein [Candidatus Obscuribacter sp.]
MKLAKALSGILLLAALQGASANAPSFAEWYDSDRSCLERARTLFGTGQFDEAQKALDKGISLNPRNAELFYMRGVLYSTLKRFDLALQDMDQALQLNPNSANYFIARGTLYSNMTKYDLAIKELKKAYLLKR